MLCTAVRGQAPRPVVYVALGKVLAALGLGFRQYSRARSLAKLDGQCSSVSIDASFLLCTFDNGVLQLQI